MLYPLTFLQRAEGKLVNIWQLYRVYRLLMKNSPLQGIFLISVYFIQFVTETALKIPMFYSPTFPYSFSKHKQTLSWWFIYYMSFNLFTLSSLHVEDDFQVVSRKHMLYNTHAFCCLVLLSSWLGHCQTAGLDEHFLCGKVNGYNVSFLHLGEHAARYQNYRKIKNSDGIIECLCEDAGALMISL